MFLKSARFFLSDVAPRYLHERAERVLGVPPQVIL